MSVRVAGRALSADPRVVAARLRRAIGAMPRPLQAWYGILVLLCLVGAVGAALAIPPGWEVLGTSPTFEWGILIAAYVFFAITTSGLCLASSLGTVFGIEMFIPLEKRHAILALLCLVTAFGIIALDLHFPVRMVVGAVLSPSLRSPMWWMGVFYGAYLVFLVIEVLSMFTGRWRIHRIACVLSSITAIIAPTTLGAVFGVLASRPYWHGAFTPPAMVSAAVLSGTALLGIVFYGVHRFRLAGFERAERLAIPAIRLLLTIILVVTMLVVGWQVAWGLYGDVPGLSTATAAILVGPLALPFWALRILVGIVVPLVLLVLPRTRTPAGLAAASSLAFVGLFADRAIFVFAGQVAPDTAVAGVASSPFAVYTPSPVELSIVVGAVAALALAYTLAERCLPMGEHSGHATGAFFGSTSGAGPVDARRAAPVPSAPVPTPVTPTANPAPVGSVPAVRAGAPIVAPVPIIAAAPIASPTPVLAPVPLHDGTGAVR
jgi:molybdopterin-containing oxidoreductase family membrane subunit